MTQSNVNDHNHFNCSEEHEFNYVAGRYGDKKSEVYQFLKDSCSNGSIKYSTHEEVYELITSELGYPHPGS